MMWIQHTLFYTNDEIPTMQSQFQTDYWKGPFACTQYQVNLQCRQLLEELLILLTKELFLPFFKNMSFYTFTYLPIRER